MSMSRGTSRSSAMAHRNGNRVARPMHQRRTWAIDPLSHLRSAGTNGSSVSADSRPMAIWSRCCVGLHNLEISTACARPTATAAPSTTCTGRTARLAASTCVRGDCPGWCSGPRAPPCDRHTRGMRRACARPAVPARGARRQRPPSQQRGVAAQPWALAPRVFLGWGSGHVGVEARPSASRTRRCRPSAAQAP